MNSIKTVGHLDGGWGAEWINIKARNREKKGWQWDLCACERVRLLLSADVCVCASVCGHMLWWLHSKGFMLMLESHRVIMYCCMMGMPFTFYIWAEVARWNTRTHAHKHKVGGKRPKQKLVKNGVAGDVARRGNKEWEKFEGDRRLIDVKDALSLPAMLIVLLGTGF